MEVCSQLWAYDNIDAFVPTQLELSTQLGQTPAAAFCHSCGLLLLDLGATQSERDVHARTCKEGAELEASEALSDGEHSSGEGSDSRESKGRSLDRAAICSNRSKKQHLGNSVGEHSPDDLHLNTGHEGSTTDTARGRLAASASKASSCGQQCNQLENSSGRIVQWLQQNDLSEHAGAFLKAGVSLDLLRFLTDLDLQQMGISALGPRRRILAAIHCTYSTPASSDSLQVQCIRPR